MISRKGEVETIIVGDHHGLTIPRINRARSGFPRLAGVRLVHTHLSGPPLNTEDLTDLVMVRLDMIAAIDVGGDGLPGLVHAAHIAPDPGQRRPYHLIEAHQAGQPPVHCAQLITAIEDELARCEPKVAATDGRDRAILVSVSPGAKETIQASLDELEALADSAGLAVVGKVKQRVKRVNPRFLMGKGKLADLMLASLRLGADLIVFDGELNASQVRSLTDYTELRVIDRTQLILDIFARRAKSREGKVQVEMAQLKYLLPRLGTRDDSLSRLSGGIGLRGPGETKLEIDRRRVRERLGRLSGELDRLSQQRRQQRSKRDQRGLPVISIVGYTNAGKSTLLNTLTKSAVRAENKLFATLDPSSRRLRLPKDQHVIITDTVGFIRDLPPDLVEAFAATLEELSRADMLLHIMDLSHPEMDAQRQAVERLLNELDLGHIPAVPVLNKMDMVSPQKTAAMAKRLGGVCVSATRSATLTPLLEVIAKGIARLPHSRGHRAA